LRAVARNSQGDVFASVLNYANLGAGGVYRSTDEGSSWTRVMNGIPVRHIRALAVKGNLLFAGTSE
jgi:hypothetical protein